MSGFGGNACWEIDLGFCRFTKCSKLFDARIIAVRKHGATTENTKDTLTLLPKMVLTEFWSKVGM
jgi:hypothetical protein